MIFFELFYTFFLIGLFTFGGGYAMIPLIEDNVVARGWLSSMELTNFIAISEVTPGPFAINIATFIGSKVGGILGSVCATIGVVLPSLIIIMIVALILRKFLANRYVKGALNGVKPVVLSLILSTAIILLIKILFFKANSLYSEFSFDIRSFGILIMLGGYLIIYKKVKKKSVSTLKLILLGALFGLLAFL